MIHFHNLANKIYHHEKFFDVQILMTSKSTG